MRRLTESVAAGLLIFHLAYLALNYAPLPDTVPTHFDFTGGADVLSPKRDVWLTWFASLGVYALLTGCTLIPLTSPLWNLPASFKQDTLGRAKRLVGEMMAWFKVLTAAIFFAVSWATVRTAYGGSAEGLLVVVLIAATLVPLVILGAYLSRMTTGESADGS